jgi:RHS repeat-associated protein
VSTNAAGLGAGDGALYKERYGWTADQLTTMTTCLANATTTATVETFAYDRALRLKAATAPQRPDAGGAYFAETFTYDGRGNRQTHGIDNAGHLEAMTYQGGLAPDLMTTSASTDAGTLISKSYTYDFDGRVTKVAWPVDSSGQPSQQYTFGYVQAGGVTDSAIKQVAVGTGGASVTYDYVYDADNRRRAKVYPTGGRDEFFWANGWQLLEDRGQKTSGYSVDEYLWLGGQPIGVRRSSFTSAWARQPQSTTSCTRLGEFAAKGCGWRHLVNNVSGRVVLAVDDARAVAGVYEYQPAGHANHQNWWGETPHPYGNSATYSMATVSEPPRGLSEVVKVRFGVLDTETLDKVTVKNSSGTQLWSGSGWHSSTLATTWLTPTATGIVTVAMTTNTCNAPPDGGTCNGYAYQGVTVEAVDYLKYASTSKAWELSLRQPGQYYDVETGLFENWNRFYDANAGRYLEPEPLLQDPTYEQRMARAGMSVPTYAYALNNPGRLADPTGKNPGTYAGAGVGTLIEPGLGTLIGAAVGTIATGVGIAWCIGTNCLGNPVQMSRPAERTPRSSCDDGDIGRPNDHDCDFLALQAFAFCIETTGNPVLCARDAAAEWIRCKGGSLPRPPNQIWPH